MIAGIDRFLLEEIDRAAGDRGKFWPENSVVPNRARFAEMIGVIDPRVPSIEVEYLATPSAPAKVAETDSFTAYAVRWPALEGVHGEGLLLQPKAPIIARVVALPDADQTPEMIAGLAPGLAPERQYARRLVENGCQVLVPTLVDRSDKFSGSDVAKTYTNQPHREWIYRQSFVLGRHPTGYEVQKILAAVDWFERQNNVGGVPSPRTAEPGEGTRPTSAVPIGVAGWGEGGLLAFYSAAVDARISAALVSGYFGPRERIWEEPLYRNHFGLLNAFGDAELTRLILPRALLVEHAPTPKFDGPAPERAGRAGAAPGKILPRTLAAVQAEFARAQKFAGPHAAALQLFHGPTDAPIGPLAEGTLESFLHRLAPAAKWSRGAPAAEIPNAARAPHPQEMSARQERQVREMERFTQRQFQVSSSARDEFLWNKVAPKTPDAWREAMRPYREKVWNEMIGRYPTGQVSLNPRTRFLQEWPTVTAHEVVLDVLPDVYAWGYLLLPKDLKPGEKRPVVVCQHGVQGLPWSVITEETKPHGFAAYQAFALRLAERGFITFAPHNPYRGDHPSRGLQRKAQPIGKTIFSIILAQHEGILDFLSGLPTVDASRIGFYGLSYGGQSAMRMPPILERYALSICSGDFNEWTWKNATTDWPRTYIYNNAYERPEFRMGLTFGYAEMAALIAPRPFMVERGHNDGVAIDEWVAFEYAKVKRLYDKLGIGDKTEIEYFDGPHTIHGVGTFKFLHKHLNWPEPRTRVER
jgi:dienelactone hydrolase